MPIFCDPAAQAGALGGVIGAYLSHADNLAAAARIVAGDPTEMLVVIGPGTFIDDALAFTAALRLERPAVGVVLVRDRIDIRLRNRALRSGVRDVIPVGDDWALAAACERSRHLSARMLGDASATEAEPAAESEIITVFAAKGGVGKTTLAANLGAVLAGEGHRVCAPVAARIPASRAVPQSINTGTPIALSNRRHPVSRAIARFAHEHLLGTPSASSSFLSRHLWRGAG